MATLPPIDESFEIVAQLKPVANVLTDLFTVDDNDQMIISTLTISNGSASPDYYFISFAPAGAADSPEQYLYQRVLVNPFDSFARTAGDTLNGTDIVRCKSVFGNLIFSLSGVRLTPR